MRQKDLLLVLCAVSVRSGIVYNSDSRNPLGTVCDRHEFNVTTLSLVPRVFSIEFLLTDFECDWVMQLGYERMGPATQARVAESNDQIWHSRGRTSTQTAMAPIADDIVERVHSRVHGILRTPTDNRSEPLQILVSHCIFPFTRWHKHLMGLKKTLFYLQVEN